MKIQIRAFIFFLTMSLCLPVLAAGFIKFDGVDGESRDKDHKGWIDVLSVSRGPAREDDASGQATGKRQHKPVTITKAIDKASPRLAKALASGEPLSNVKIDTGSHITVLKSAQIVAIEKDGKGNEIVTLVPAAARAQDVKPSRSVSRPGSAETGKKGNVETTWKVEEGEK